MPSSSAEKVLLSYGSSLIKEFNAIFKTSSLFFSMLNKIEERIVKPTISGLQKDNLPYQGFIFIGIIKVGDDPKVIEYNVRMGDPETEVVLPRVKTDMVEIFEAISNKSLDKIDIEIDDRAATTVMLVSGGYPEAYEKGKEISGLENVESCIAFHAGTTTKEGKLVTNGGRVLAFTAMADTKEKALQQSYSAISKICFDGITFRKDIGFDL